MSLIIAGERSGVGKTTITLSILAYLAKENHNIVRGFKVGPDYIDPMFHKAITGSYSRNLDPVLTSPDYVRSCFALHSSKADYVVIEGVMGLFDGIRLHSESDYASTAHIARLLNIPVLLVLDCSRLSGSIAAIAHGYRSLDPRIKIAGVVLNRVASDRHLELLQDALDNINMPILGVVRRYDEITIPDRYLGLIPTAELPEITQVFDKLAHIAKTAFNWEKLLPLLRTTNHCKGEQPQGVQQLLLDGKRRGCGRNLLPPFKSPVQDEVFAALGCKLQVTEDRTASPFAPNTDKSLKIAIAQDRAFNFYYQDNFDILRYLGAELIFWSPLADCSVPKDVAGFYFGGGFPEIFAEELAANTRVKQQLRQLIAQDIPVYAECGGLMYFCDRIIDLQGETWEMVGVIPTTAKMTPRLTLGYRQVFPLNSSSLISLPVSSAPPHPCTPAPIWGHEFHRSKVTAIATQPLWQIKGCSPRSKKIAEGWQINNVSASYIHLHFGTSQNLLKNWLDCCRDFKNRLL